MERRDGQLLRLLLDDGIKVDKDILGGALTCCAPKFVPIISGL
jgi:hypothetical protein